MESQKVLRTGLVGCGWHGHALAQTVVRSKLLHLVACADPDATAASQAAALASDVSTHSSVEALLSESEVDAILIATPHHLLAPVALAGLRAGKHVMAEKPIALNDREGAEIEAAAKQAGVCYMPGYSMRFLMGRYVRELLDAGVAGEIRAVTGSFGMGPLDSDWIAYPETGGGPLLYVGCHLVDLLLWFLDDDPVEVYATVQYRADTGADATSTFQICFAKGALAQCLVTQAASTFFYEVDIHGSAGKISLRGRSLQQFEIEVSSNAVPAYKDPTNIRPYLRGDHIPTMLLPELEEFARASLEHRAPLTTVADGRRTLQVLDAVMQSGRSNLPVKLREG